MSAQWTFPFISVWFRHYAPCCTALFVGQTEKCMSCHLCFPTSWSYEYHVGLFCARCHMLHAQLTAVTPPHWESTPSCELERCNLTFSLGTAACSDNWSRRTVNCKLWTANCKLWIANCELSVGMQWRWKKKAVQMEVYGWCWPTCKQLSPTGEFSVFMAILWADPN